MSRLNMRNLEAYCAIRIKEELRRKKPDLCRAYWDILADLDGSGINVKTFLRIWQAALLWVTAEEGENNEY